MLKTTIIHPELIAALAEAGHGAQILIADSNYPVTVQAPLAARKVFLNFTPGMISGCDIIKAIAETIPVEAAAYMTPPDGAMPEIVQEYRKLIDASTPFNKLGRFEFYDAARSPMTCLVVASGEQRVYANLLLTVGVVPPKIK